MTKRRFRLRSNQLILDPNRPISARACHVRCVGGSPLFRLPILLPVEDLRKLNSSEQVFWCFLLSRNHTDTEVILRLESPKYSQLQWCKQCPVRLERRRGFSAGNPTRDLRRKKIEEIRFRSLSASFTEETAKSNQNANRSRRIILNHPSNLQKSKPLRCKFT